MKPDTWMPLYIADYDQAVSRLSLEQDAAYMRLIRDYWINGPPPDDDETLARIVRIDRRHWLKLRPVVALFFKVENGLWSHKRVDHERTRAASIIEQRREAGRKGGRPRKLASEPGDEPATEKANAKPNGFAPLKRGAKQTKTPARVARPTPPQEGNDALTERVIPFPGVHAAACTLTGASAISPEVREEVAAGMKELAASMRRGRRRGGED